MCFVISRTVPFYFPDILSFWTRRVEARSRSFYSESLCGCSRRWRFTLCFRNVIINCSISCFIMMVCGYVLMQHLHKCLTFVARWHWRKSNLSSILRVQAPVIWDLCSCPLSWFPFGRWCCWLFERQSCCSLFAAFWCCPFSLRQLEIVLAAYCGAIAHDGTRGQNALPVDQALEGKKRPLARLGFLVAFELQVSHMCHL